MNDVTQVNYEISQRIDRTYPHTITDNGVEVPLGDFSLKYVAEDPNTKTEVINKSDGNGIDILDALNGQIEINITNIDTDIATGLYKHELTLVEDSTGRRYKAFEGTLKITESITD